MLYMHSPANRNEVIQYIARYHNIDFPAGRKSVQRPDALL